MIKRTRSAGALVLLGLTSPLAVLAQPAATPASPPSPPPEGALVRYPTNARVAKMGEIAPPPEVSDWVKGEKVTTFEPGKAYIIEFWATWCGPCVGNMPHLTRLQNRYRDKGLTIIGVSSADRGGVADVKPFVDKQGSRMNYTVAVDDQYKTGDTYLSATGQTSIPVAYLIDKSGKLVWFGHPQGGLDDVLVEVMAGTFDAGAFTKRQEAVREHSQRIQQAMGTQEWDTAEKELLDIERLYPAQAADAEMGRVVVGYAYKKDKPTAVTLCGKLVDGVLKDDFDRLVQLAEMIANDTDPPAAAKDLALKIAERLVAIAQDDQVTAYTTLADVRQSRGEHDLAVAAQQKALAASSEYDRKGQELKLTQLQSRK